ncbi:unnamed protein product [Linum tenue]|uniref:MADS-box domain-containing protein n=1 Tax=Linum tenue TaxID=586396 RepID=A0AAV0QZ98_9ROSI|nr:unnamed protein product [Linum tenue]
MKKSNSTSLGLKVTYPKRRDAIVKKATELSVLCGTDVSLILFSPKGKLTSFATHGRFVLPWDPSCIYSFFVSFFCHALFWCWMIHC